MPARPVQGQRAGARRVAMLAVALGAIAVACGSGDDGPKLSDVAQRGKELAGQRACVGCHGRNGEGGQSQTGPPWVGLYGSTVEFDDGSTAIADDAYLYEAIREPAATQVAGWRAMPKDNLSDSDILSIIAYIKELATPADP